MISSFFLEYIMFFTLHQIGRFFISSTLTSYNNFFIGIGKRDDKLIGNVSWAVSLDLKDIAI